MSALPEYENSFQFAGQGVGTNNPALAASF